jgi:hypothetical protein
MQPSIKLEAKRVEFLIHGDMSMNVRCMGKVVSMSIEETLSLRDLIAEMQLANEIDLVLRAEPAVVEYGYLRRRIVSLFEQTLNGDSGYLEGGVFSVHATRPGNGMADIMVIRDTSTGDVRVFIREPGAEFFGTQGE